MKKSRCVALAFLVAAAAGCADEAGSFELTLGWAGGVAPELPQAVHVQARILDSNDQIVANSPNVPYRSGVELAFERVPYDRRLIAVVEIRAAAADTSQVLYHARSNPFVLQVGTQTTVNVLFDLTPGPGVVDPVAISIPRRVRSGTVDLEVSPGDASRVMLSNSSAFNSARVVDLVSGESLQTVRWDLNDGLPSDLPCISEPSDVCPRRVYASFEDEFQNRSLTVSAETTLDNLPPTIVDGSTSIQLVPTSSSARNDPSTSSYAVSAVLRFTASEPLAVVPVVRALSESQTVVLERTNVTANTHTYQWTPARDVAEDTYRCQVLLRDSAANESSVDLDASHNVIVDQTAPVAPRVEGNGGLRYMRRPWGDTTSASPRWTVEGDVSSVEPGAKVEIERVGVGIVGTQEARADGSVGPIVLQGADSASVRARSVDAAGLASPWVEIRDIAWTATMNGKIRGSGASNPHRIVHLGGEVRQCLWHANDGLGGTEPLQADLDGLGLQGDARSYAVQSERTWSLRRPAEVSGLRANAGVVTASEPITGRLLLHSDHDTPGIDQESWSWDGDMWTFLGRGSGPRHRGLATIAVEPKRARIIVFGGGDMTWQHLDELWRWDGLVWTQLNPPVSPSPRSDPTMAGNPATGNVVLFGGRDDTSDLGDTWIWDGEGWEHRAVVGPTARSRVGLAYDEPTRKVVLFGGAAGTDLLNDTWVWDGERWTEVSVPAPPDAARVPIMATDPDTGGAVLYGDRAHWRFEGSHWQLIDDPVTKGPTNYSATLSGALRTGGFLSFDTRPGLGSGQVFSAFHGDRFNFGNNPNEPLLGALLGDPGEDVLLYKRDAAQLRTWPINGLGWGVIRTVNDPPREVATDPMTLELMGIDWVDAPGGCQREQSAYGFPWTVVVPSGPRPPANCAITSLQMALDAGRGRVIAFEPPDLTWEWDGLAWRSVVTLNTPTGQYVHAPSLGGLVAVGSDAIKRFDGSTWMTVGPGVAEPVVYDNRRHRLQTPSGLEFDGMQWVPGHTGALPPLYSPSAFVFDPRTGRTLAHGGYIRTDITLNTYLLSAPDRSFASVRWEIDARGTELPVEALRDVTFVVNAGGTGGGDAQPEHGYAFEVWTNGRYLEIGRSSAPADSVARSEFNFSHDVDRRGALGDDGVIYVRLRSLGADLGSTPARLDIDALQVDVRYASAN
ncbi:MAG: hypothetical protein RMA76_04365 [Deltaproteobacteria bacterium]